MQIERRLRSFIEQQVDDGEVGSESEFVFKNLIIRMLKTEWVSVFLGVFGMYQQTQVVLRVGLESGGDGNFILSLQQFEQRLRELEVEIEQKFEFLFENNSI